MKFEYSIISILIIFQSIFASELKIGDEMPETNYQLNDISGNQITLNEIKGKNGTLIIFSCNTCPWVIRWEDRYVEIASSYLKRDIGMIAINSNVARFNGDDSLHKMKKHAKEKELQFSICARSKRKISICIWC